MPLEVGAAASMAGAFVIAGSTAHLAQYIPTPQGTGWIQIKGLTQGNCWPG
jgi:hypothetical protein